MDCSDTEKDSSDTETAILPGEYSEKKVRYSDAEIETTPKRSGPN